MKSKGWLYNKKIVAVLSLLAAVVMWLVISITQNPTRELTVNNIPITINTENTAVSQLGLDVVTDLSKTTAAVKVSGPNYIVSSLSPSDITVSASLSQVTAAGTYDLPLTATRNSNKIGYDVIEVTPASVNVTFDNIDTKTFEVTAVASGIKAADGLVADIPVLTDSLDNTIDITGPNKEIIKIDKVTAVTDAEKTISTTESFDAKIILLDKEGKELDKSPYKFDRDSIKVSVPIYKKAELSVEPVFTNVPAVYSGGVPYELSEQTVTVLGPPDVVNNLTSIKLKAIDFSSINAANTEFDVGFDLPNSVKTLDNIESVHIKLKISSIVEKSFSVSNYEYRGLGDGLKATVTSSVKNVKMCGASSEVYSLKSGDLYAEIDLTGKSAGEYTVTAAVKSKKGNSVWAYGKYTVIVTVSKQK